MELSLIMPAKNAGEFIIDALNSLNNISKIKFELIVVNDESSDDTFEKVDLFRSKSIYPITLVNNPNRGKVEALNYGYSLSAGEYIKCIDADDLLLPNYFDFFKEKPNFDAHCHDAIIVDSLLRNIGIYTINSSFLRSSYTEVMTNFISLPRWVWTFNQEIANIIFPIPEDLPFEDVWFSLIIKKYAKLVLYSPEQYYLYRQHASQTFGGINNYNEKIVIFRAKRLIKYIEVLLSKKTVLYDDFNDNKKLILKNYKYNKYLAKTQLNLLKFIRDEITFIQKIKIFLFKKIPIVVPSIKKLLWLIDRVRRFY
jgi:glycosyltransferase involved in cell wall biosynthesis